MQKRDEKDFRSRNAAHVERLIREGKAIRYGTGRVSKEFFELPMPEDPEGLLLKALLEDRRNGR